MDGGSGKMDSGAEFLRSALLARCPRCGKGRLFAGLLALAPKCSECGLDFSGFDPGDGPAVFVILIAGALAAAGALWFEFTYSPPIWLQGVIWIPGIALLSVGLLRLAKSLLVTLQYRHQAREGRRVE